MNQRRKGNLEFTRSGWLGVVRGGSGCFRVVWGNSGVNRGWFGGWFGNITEKRKYYKHTRSVKFK